MCSCYYINNMLKTSLLILSLIALVGVGLSHALANNMPPSGGIIEMVFAQTLAPTSNVTLTTPAAPISLGNLFYKETGKITSQRALDMNGALFENSYSANGTLNGNIPVMNIGTITVYIFDSI